MDSKWSAKGGDIFFQILCRENGVVDSKTSARGGRRWVGGKMSVAATCCTAPSKRFPITFSRQIIAAPPILDGRRQSRDPQYSYIGPL